MPMRRTLSSLLLLAGFAVSACTAILVPDAGDDGVARCNVTDDCPDIADNRYVPACVFGEGQPENSDKICTSDYEEIECGETFYDAEHPLSVAWAAADDASSNYVSCDQNGTLGCRANGGTSCDSGLEVNRHGTCDEPGNDIPLIDAREAGNSDAAGKDMQDQFCRSYFFDERFVCDTSLSKPVCVVCNNNDAFGEGGCATLYVNGAPSPAYDPGLKNSNGDVPTTGEPGLPDGDPCNADDECMSGSCYLVPFLGGYCGECNEDADCMGGGCTPPNPYTEAGSVCNAGDPGDGCETTMVCEDGLVCSTVLELLGLVTLKTCGECSTDADCGGGLFCAPIADFAEWGGQMQCIMPGTLPQDSYCLLDGNGDSACSSGVCSPIDVMGLTEIGACGQCLEDADCMGSCDSGSFDIGTGELLGSQCI